MRPKRAEDFVHHPVAELIEHLVLVRDNEFDLRPRPRSMTDMRPITLGDDRTPSVTSSAPTVQIDLPEPDLSTLSFTGHFAASELPADHPPVSIANVQIEAYLGGGSFGCVYAGRIASTGLVVAVKVLRADDSHKR